MHMKSLFHKKSHRKTLKIRKYRKEVPESQKSACGWVVSYSYFSSCLFKAALVKSLNNGGGLFGLDFNSGCA